MRFLQILLAAVLALSLVPAAAFADDEIASGEEVVESPEAGEDDAADGSDPEEGDTEGEDPSDEEPVEEEPTYETITVKKTAVTKKNGKILELRAKAGLKLYKYDTVQGSCTDGKFGYYVMYNRTKEKCRIVKMKLANNKVKAVSGVLKIDHGNDLTYNSATNRIIAVHCTQHMLRLSIIKPGKLTVESTVDVQIPTKIEGATKKQTAAITKISGIAYMEATNQYVAITGTHNFLILDENFNPLLFIKTQTKIAQLYQGITCDENYIYLAQATYNNSQSNQVLIYDYNGVLLRVLKIPSCYEIESLYFVGTKLYASVYRSYWGTYYTTKTVKVKKKNGKVKRTTVKVAHTGTVRDNYVYKITGF